MRRILRRLSAMSLAIMLLSTLTNLNAYAVGSTIEAEFNFTNTEVVIIGTLSASGQPLAEQRILAGVDGAQGGETQTDAAGRFQVSVPLTNGLANGSHQIVVYYPGSGNVEATSDSTEFIVAEDPTDTAPSSSAPAASAPEVAAPQTLLEVSGPETAMVGDLVSISGRLTDASGSGIAGAGISLTDEAGDVEDSFTITDDSGAFNTFYAINSDQAAGTVSISLNFSGASGLPATSQRLAIDVDVPEIVDTASPSPTAEDAAPAAAEEEAAAAATPSPEQSAAPETSANLPAQSPIVTWFLAALVAVGGLAIIATVALVLRGRFASRTARETEISSLDFLDDDPAEPVEDSSLNQASPISSSGYPAAAPTFIAPESAAPATDFSRPRRAAPEA